MASPDLSKSVSPDYLVSLILLAVPVLQPLRVMVISLLLTLKSTLGAVMLLIFCNSTNALLKCFSEILKNFYPIGILPTPKETTNPLCLASFKPFIFPEHFLESI